MTEQTNDKPQQHDSGSREYLGFPEVGDLPLEAGRRYRLRTGHAFHDFVLVGWTSVDAERLTWGPYLGKEPYWRDLARGPNPPEDAPGGTVNFAKAQEPLPEGYGMGKAYRREKSSRMAALAEVNDPDGECDLIGDPRPTK